MLLCKTSLWEKETKTRRCFIKIITITWKLLCLFWAAILWWCFVFIRRTTHKKVIVKGRIIRNNVNVLCISSGSFVYVHNFLPTRQQRTLHLFMSWMEYVLEELRLNGLRNIIIVYVHIFLKYPLVIDFIKLNSVLLNLLDLQDRKAIVSGI